MFALSSITSWSMTEAALQGGASLTMPLSIITEFIGLVVGLIALVVIGIIAAVVLAIIGIIIAIPFAVLYALFEDTSPPPPAPPNPYRHMDALSDQYVQGVAKRLARR